MNLISYGNAVKQHTANKKVSNKTVFWEKKNKKKQLSIYMYFIQNKHKFSDFQFFYFLLAYFSLLKCKIFVVSVEESTRHSTEASQTPGLWVNLQQAVVGIFSEGPSIKFISSPFLCCQKFKTRCRQMHSSNAFVQCKNTKLTLMLSKRPLLCS